MNTVTVPRPARTQRERSEGTRAQLIAAAIEVVRDKTFAGASVFEVAKAAGVTPGAFQHHFGNKAELMMQVTEAILRGDVEGPLPWPAATGSPRLRSQRMVRMLWERVYEPERFLVAWQIYFGSCTDGALRGRIVARRQELSALLHERFLACLPELAGQRDSADFVATVLSTLRGIGLLRLFGPQPEGIEAQLAQLARMIEQRCAAAPATPRKSPP